MTCKDELKKMAGFAQMEASGISPDIAAINRHPRIKGGAAIHEPDPLPGQEVVLGYALQALKDRAEAGREKYGTYLMTDNGRDALMDAYQEALDLVMYLTQALVEREKNE